MRYTTVEVHDEGLEGDSEGDQYFSDTSVSSSSYSQHMHDQQDGMERVPQSTVSVIETSCKSGGLCK